MKLGVSFFTFSPDVSIMESIRSCAKAGYEGIEPTMNEEGPFSFESTEKELLAIKQMAGDLGLEVPFSMSYRVNFESGGLIFANGRVFERRTDGTEFEAEISSDMGYYLEIKHFIDCVENDMERMISPDDSAESIRIIEAEIASADKNGQLEYLS